MEENANSEDALLRATGGSSTPPSPEEVIREEYETNELAEKVKSIEHLGGYVPEANNKDILIRGRWLERGGSAWWISTAGTGKSIASIQLAYMWGAGLPFAGLEPNSNRPVKTWIFQSEDSPSRMIIDREDVVAELKEQYPDVDWNRVGRVAVKIVKLSGKVGVDFLAELDRLIRIAKRKGDFPDLIIINPFLAFVGGPVTDGGYVTQFLRGGEIEHKHTDGLQAILERHNIAALIFHHTAKPPSEKDVDQWMKSTFPEYQGAGSSDITNWGRSFVTMMKVKNRSGLVCLVAGKNGSEIGWDVIGDVRMRYLAWSRGVSITGGRRHAWRELTDEEYDEIVGPQIVDNQKEIDDATEKIVAGLKEVAATRRQCEANWSGKIKRSILRNIIASVFSNPIRYGMHSEQKQLTRKGRISTLYGTAESIRRAVEASMAQERIDETRKEDF